MSGRVFKVAALLNIAIIITTLELLCLSVTICPQGSPVTENFEEKFHNAGNIKFEVFSIF